MFTRVASALTSLMVLAGAAAAATPPRYAVTVLSPPPLPPTGGLLGPIAINNQGQALVESGLPYVYTNGSYAPVPPLLSSGLGLPFHYARDINDSGQVVGFDTVNGLHAFLFSGGATTGLGFPNLQALVINNKGQVAGDVLDPASQSPDRAFLYSGGSLTVLPTLGGDEGNARQINDSGQIVGASNLTAGGVLHPYLYSNGTATDLGLLPGFVTGWAWGINQHGDTVGWLSTTSPGGWADQKPFLYHDGVMAQLPLPGGYSNGRALYINDTGQVVGFVDGITSAFLYTDGQTYDLKQLFPGGTGWQIDELGGINDAGQILIGATVSDASPNPEVIMLLTPVPEPSALAIWALAGLALCRRRA